MSLRKLFMRVYSDSYYHSRLKLKSYDNTIKNLMGVLIIGNGYTDLYCLLGSMEMLYIAKKTF